MSPCSLVSPCRLVSPVPGFVTLMPYASATYTVWASRRSYTYSEGPPDLGVPEKVNFSLESCISGTKLCQKRNSTRKFWEKCKTDCFF